MSPFPKALELPEVTLQDPYLFRAKIAFVSSAVRIVICSFL